ncbi:glycosyl transferases group 1 family protein [Synechococcus sp. A18-46.1]|nr:glycosyl transferases group 1 family protein [Synechococcus sp. A18-46.1]
MTTSSSSKILILNDFYYAAGAETVFRDYTTLLGSNCFIVHSCYASKTPHTNIFSSILNIFKLYIRVFSLFCRPSKCPDIVIVHNFISRLTVFIFWYIFVLKLIFNRNCIVYHVLHDYGLLCPSSGYFYYTSSSNMSIKSNIRCFNYQPSLGSLLFSRIDIRSLFHDVYKKFRWIITFLFFNRFLINGFISPSPFIRNLFTLRYPNINNYLIYNPLITLSEPQSLPVVLPDSNHRLLNVAFLGRNSPEKGLSHFVNYLSSLPMDLNIHFFVALKQSQINHIHTQLPQHTLCFHGFLDRVELYDKLSLIDLIVVPSVWFENAPLVVVESLLLGIPVLVNKFGSLETFSIDSSNVYYYQDFTSFSNFFTSFCKHLISFDDNDKYLSRFSSDNFLSSLSALF